MPACGNIMQSLLVGIALTAAVSSQAAEVRRCEDEHGRVTYSNEACPSGTTRERNVEERPPVELPRDAGTGPPARVGATVRNAVPEGGVSLSDGGRDRERNSEQKKARIARCDDLARRIEFAQQDLLAAAPGERASFELGVRRLQQEQAANCTTLGAR